MINKDRIVPVTKTDLLSLYRTIVMLRQTVETVEATGIGVFEIKLAEGSENYLFLNEPVKKVNVASANFRDGVLYFVPATDFEGITIDGQPITYTDYTDEIIPDGVTLYVANRFTSTGKWSVQRF